MTVRDQLKDRLWAVTSDPDEARRYSSKDNYDVHELFSRDGANGYYYIGLI